ncbi:hypothetical protein EDC37_10262 [Pectinatus cerevisiiphilus]|uniref:Uncharacterized protein n=2 Tax=Pectinatus cerevisiiphilus TaxID=86956 RepID=A0A4R3KDK4_9FIRM|nr:hypothetical protein EDC37_10262 [Pectinatus cerevisiiphilus]
MPHYTYTSAANFNKGEVANIMQKTSIKNTENTSFSQKYYLHKYFVILFAIFLLYPGSVYAEDAQNDALNWQISVLPPAETAAEKEALRWTQLMDNSIGIYYFDKNRIFATKDPFGNTDKNILQVDIKTFFVNEKLLDYFNMTLYAAQLGKDEKTAYCVQTLLFNMHGKLYRELKTDVYTDKGRLLAETATKSAWKPIPEHSFAELMWQTLQQVPLGQLKREDENS